MSQMSSFRTAKLVRRVMTTRIDINTHNQYNSPGVTRGDLKSDAIEQLTSVRMHMRMYRQQL